MRRLLVATLGIFSLPLLTATDSHADVQDITIAVDGVVCPVCAHSINMGLRHLSGIKTVKVLMENRVNVDIRLHPGIWVEPNRLFQQISQVGYRARQAEVKMRLRGTATASGSTLLLTMDDVASGPVVFQLAPVKATGKRGDESRAALQILQDALQAKNGPSTVEVEGWWRAARTKEEHPQLLVTQTRVRPDSM